MTYDCGSTTLSQYRQQNQNQPSVFRHSTVPLFPTCGAGVSRIAVPPTGKGFCLFLALSCPAFEKRPVSPIQHTPPPTYHSLSVRTVRKMSSARTATEPTVKGVISPHAIYINILHTTKMNLGTQEFCTFVLRGINTVAHSN